MKKIIIILTVLTLLFTQSALTVMAQTGTVVPSKSPTPTKATDDNKLNTKINDLKEKIASRVSELNLVERRGIIGTISAVSGNKITMEDSNGDTRIIDVDEITKFSSGATTKSSFGLSDLTKGTKISVLGLYNKQSKRLLARFISTSVDPLFFSGTITAIDKKQYYITVTTPDEKQHVVDVLTTTKTQIYDKEAGLEKGGFSQLSVGSRVTVIGFPDKKDPELLAAQRIIDLTVLPKNPKITVAETEASASATEQ